VVEKAKTEDLVLRSSGLKINIIFNIYYNLKMSIFQIKELWGTRVGNSEEFDHNSICLGNLDNEAASATSSPELKIAIG
jgi:hypothetical protein